MAGRPTNDPKTALVAVRLAPRHVQMLERRAKHNGVSMSEALRQILDEKIAAPRRAKIVKGTAKRSGLKEQ